MKNFKYKIVLLISFVIFIICPKNIYASAETLGDLRKEYESLKAKLDDYNRKSAEAKKEMANKKNAIIEAQAALTKAEAEQIATEDAINASNNKISELSEEAKKIVLYMQQMQDSNVYVEYVSGASTVTEMIMRIEAVKQINEYIDKTINDLKIEIKTNEELKEKLIAKQKELASNIDNYEKKVAELALNAETYDEYALDVETEYKLVKANYEEYKKTCQTNLGSTKDSLLLTDCTKVPVNSGWLNPLKYGVITSTMGYRTHPTTGKVYSFHNGIDIGGNSEGTPIYAAAAGRVSGFVSKYYCGGNMLYIQVTVKGKKYTTFYYHLKNVNVKVGDIVDQNTVIGTVGGYTTSTIYGGYDACSTGAHLHYGVAEGWYTGHTTNVITPPGFMNKTGYRFTSRTDMYFKN